MIYITRDGDVLDAIIDRFYGSTSGYLEAVLAANPGLSSMVDIFDCGVKINLPDILLTKNTAKTLWD